MIDPLWLCNTPKPHVQPERVRVLATGTNYGYIVKTRSKHTYQSCVDPSVRVSILNGPHV